MGRSYNFNSKVWVHTGDNAWCFVNLPLEVTEEINFLYDHLKRGWGSLKVKVKIGNTEWKTSIFPEKKSKTYILPLKGEIRKKEHIVVGKVINVVLEILDI